MIRSYTPLPKPPSAERDCPELLDVMLRAVQGCGPLTSAEVVSLTRALMPSATPHDIRMMLKPPYFALRNKGWVCRWNMLFSNHDAQATTKAD